MVRVATHAWAPSYGGSAWCRACGGGGEGVRQKPRKWRQRIAGFYRMMYRADRGHAGVLTHNPVHPQWDVVA